MILVDANLLLYAYQPRAAQHVRAKQWLERALSGSEFIRFAWVTVWGFIRIATNPRVFEQPLAVSEAEAIVSSWLARPNVGILEPGERHWEVLRGLMQGAQGGTQQAATASSESGKRVVCLRGNKRLSEVEFEQCLRPSAGKGSHGLHRSHCTIKETRPVRRPRCTPRPPALVSADR